MLPRDLLPKMEQFDAKIRIDGVEPEKSAEFLPSLETVFQPLEPKAERDAFAQKLTAYYFKQIPQQPTRDRGTDREIKQDSFEQYPKRDRRFRKLNDPLINCLLDTREMFGDRWEISFRYADGFVSREAVEQALAKLAKWFLLCHVIWHSVTIII